MTFDIIKLIIFGANSGYFLYMGASQNSSIYIGVGILLFFAMVGTVGFIPGMCHNQLSVFALLCAVNREI